LNYFNYEGKIKQNEKISFLRGERPFIMNKKQLIVVCFVAGIFAYTGYEISRLSNRIQKIEDRLGGQKRVLCNEKDTITKVRYSVVRIVGGEGEGSGFAFQKGGYILTNFHVIASEPSPKVVLPDNTFETAQIIMADKDADLAVLKINKDLPVLKFARFSFINPAEEVFSIGFPLGGELPGESSITRGSFSRFTIDKENDVQYLLTDMTLVEGISGGPMVNICGEVVGINTAGLSPGGIGIAISTDSIFNRCNQVATLGNPLKDVEKIAFEPNKNAIEAVRCFYNYLKVREMEKAFELLSDNFIKGYSFEHWLKGYRPMMDASIIMIKPDKKIANRIQVKLSTKDLVDDEIVYKYFEGYWDVRQVNGKWLLWNPKIRETQGPEKEWFLDQELIQEIEAFIKEHDGGEAYKYDMYGIAQEPGNEGLSIQELYDRASGKR
jgi:hypothetical protein